MDTLKYEPGEKMDFAFCEPVTARPLRPWCIRKVGPEGLKLGGGIPNEPLCRRWATNGWDLEVRIRMDLLDHSVDGRRTVCADCADEYKALMAKKSAEEAALLSKAG